MPKRFPVAVLLCALALPGVASAQPTAVGDAPALSVLPPLPGDHPFASQVLSSDLLMQAARATVYQDGDAQVVVLEGDAVVTIGLQGFRSPRAVVRVESAPGYGAGVRHLAIYLEEAEPVGGAGVRMQGSGLLVTAAISGRVDVDTALFERAEAMPTSPLVSAAQSRMAEYRRALRAPLLDPQPGPAFDPATEDVRDARRAAIEQERRRIDPTDPRLAGPRTDPDLVDRSVLPTRGTVRYAVDRAVLQMGEREDAVMLIGNVRVLYEDEDEGRDVLLTADKVVIFIEKEDAADNAPRTAPTQVDASRIRGVYLEGNAVISDGDASVRAPRAYYDLKQNRAVLLEAVVYAVDTQRQVPLYLRAEVIRQTSADAFEARGATLTTSEFAKPHLALGADRITMRQSRQPDGFMERYVTASGITLKSEDTPFFYWPYLAAPAHALPLKRITAGYSSSNGLNVQTAWDIYALMGRRAPEGVELLGNLDYRGDHGPGVGVEFSYDREAIRGELRGYLLPSDSGEDDIADRNDVAFDGDTRGFLHLQHRQDLPSGWELSVEGSHISDPSFLEEFYRDEAYAARPYQTSIYLKKAQDDWALTGLLSYETNNFTAQMPTLLTPGYTVDKLPEVAYYRGTSLLDDRLTWYHESRIGTVRARFGDDSPADRGFTMAQSMSLFGIPNTTSFDAAARAAGFPTSTVGRFDTRNELAMPMRAGIFDITPFIVGRITAYDDDFANYNGGNDDQARFWGGAGVELSTEFTRTYAASNELLDLNGIRHIVEPSATVAIYGSSFEDGELPIYDPEIEDLAEGAVIRIGAVNTLQTRRGREGRQRTVDWLKLRTDFVMRSNDADTDTVIPRFIDHRPEYSLGGDHFYGELLWAVTQSVAVTGEVTYNFEMGNVVQWRLGTEMRHDDHLSTFAHYREIDPIDARLLTYGFALDLTTKYRLVFSHTLDFGASQSRSINLALDRKLPRARLQFLVSYDEIDDDTTIGLVLIPDGFGSGLGNGGVFGGP
ncbi:MAG: LPS-assembly protein LptD [Phycisphaerales bacterium JB063]